MPGYNKELRKLINTLGDTIPSDQWQATAFKEYYLLNKVFRDSEPHYLYQEDLDCLLVLTQAMSAAGIEGSYSPYNQRQIVKTCYILSGWQTATEDKIPALGMSIVGGALYSVGSVTNASIRKVRGEYYTTQELITQVEKVQDHAHAIMMLEDAAFLTTMQGLLDPCVARCQAQYEALRNANSDTLYNPLSGPRAKLSNLATLQATELAHYYTDAFLATQLTPVIDVLAHHIVTSAHPAPEVVQAFLALTKAQYTYQENCFAIYKTLQHYYTHVQCLLANMEQEVDALYAYLQPIDGPASIRRSWMLTWNSTRVNNKYKALCSIEQYLATLPHDQGQTTGHNMNYLLKALQSAQKQVLIWEQDYEDIAPLSTPLVQIQDTLATYRLQAENAQADWQAVCARINTNYQALESYEAGFPFIHEQARRYSRALRYTTAPSSFQNATRDLLRTLEQLQKPTNLVSRAPAPQGHPSLAPGEANLFLAHEQRLLVAIRASKETLSHTMEALQQAIAQLAALQQEGEEGNQAIDNLLAHYWGSYHALEAQYQDLQCYAIMAIGQSAASHSNEAMQEAVASRVAPAGHHNFQALQQDIQATYRQQSQYSQHAQQEAQHLELLQAQARTFAHAPLLQELLEMRQQHSQRRIQDLEIAQLTLQTHADHLQKIIRFRQQLATLARLVTQASATMIIITPTGPILLVATSTGTTLAAKIAADLCLEAGNLQEVSKDLFSRATLQEVGTSALTTTLGLGLPSISEVVAQKLPNDKRVLTFKAFFKALETKPHLLTTSQRVVGNSLRHLKEEATQTAINLVASNTVQVTTDLVCGPATSDQTSTPLTENPQDPAFATSHAKQSFGSQVSQAMVDTCIKTVSATVTNEIGFRYRKHQADQPDHRATWRGYLQHGIAHAVRGGAEGAAHSANATCHRNGKVDWQEVGQAAQAGALGAVVSEKVAQAVQNHHLTPLPSPNNPSGNLEETCNDLATLPQYHPEDLKRAVFIGKIATLAATYMADFDPQHIETGYRTASTGLTHNFLTNRIWEIHYIVDLLEDLEASYQEGGEEGVAQMLLEKGFIKQEQTPHGNKRYTVPRVGVYDTLKEAFVALKSKDRQFGIAIEAFIPRNLAYQAIKAHIAQGTHAPEDLIQAHQLSQELQALSQELPSDTNFFEPTPQMREQARRMTEDNQNNVCAFFYVPTYTEAEYLQNLVRYASNERMDSSVLSLHLQQRSHDIQRDLHQVAPAQYEAPSVPSGPDRQAASDPWKLTVDAYKCKVDQLIQDPSNSAQAYNMIDFLQILSQQVGKSCPQAAGRITDLHKTLNLRFNTNQTHYRKAFADLQTQWDALPQDDDEAIRTQRCALGEAMCKLRRAYKAEDQQYYHRLENLNLAMTATIHHWRQTLNIVLPESQREQSPEFFSTYTLEGGTYGFIYGVPKAITGPLGSIASCFSRDELGKASNALLSKAYSQTEGAPSDPTFDTRFVANLQQAMEEAPNEVRDHLVRYLHGDVRVHTTEEVMIDDTYEYPDQEYIRTHNRVGKGGLLVAVDPEAACNYRLGMALAMYQEQRKLEKQAGQCQFDHAEEVHREWHERSGKMVGRLAGDLAVAYVGGKFLTMAVGAIGEAVAVAELAEAGLAAKEASELRSILTIADKARYAEEMAAFIARNEALLPALEQLGLLVEAVEGAAEVERVARAGKVVKRVTFDSKRMGHIFRAAEGHVLDTSVNRNLLESMANNPLYKLGPDQHGAVWHAQILSNGTQAWTRSLHGRIVNAGINKVPKPYNPITGLCAIKPFGR